MDAGALSLNQGEKILSSHDFFQLSRTTKSKKIFLHNEAVLIVDDSTNTFDVSTSFPDFFSHCFQNHTFVKEVVKHFCETILCVCAEF